MAFAAWRVDIIYTEGVAKILNWLSKSNVKVECHQNVITFRAHRNTYFYQFATALCLKNAPGLSCCNLAKT